MGFSPVSIVLFTAITIIVVVSAYPTYYQQQHIKHGNLTEVYRRNATMKEHYYTAGVSAPQEKQLLHTFIYKRPGYWSNYASLRVIFPPPGSRVRMIITRIVATDNSRNGTGAAVLLEKGGPGRENATLLFKSRKNEPINYILDIFGYPIYPRY